MHENKSCKNYQNYDIYVHVCICMHICPHTFFAGSATISWLCRMCWYQICTGVEHNILLFKLRRVGKDTEEARVVVCVIECTVVGREALSFACATTDGAAAVAAISNDKDRWYASDHQFSCQVRLVICVRGATHWAARMG